VRKLAWVVLVAVPVWWCGCSLDGEPLADGFRERQAWPVRAKPAAEQTAVPPAPDRLKVMAWNIKFGAARIDFWFDFWGDRVKMSSREVRGNLDALARLLAETRPDILMTEETELNSRRSDYVDMVGYLLEHTHFNYAAYVPTWRSRYIPSEGLGRMNMGNAIFSVYPITAFEGVPLSDRTDQDALHEEFYLHRQVGRATIQVGARSVTALVVHTEAYDTDGTKSRQLVEIRDLARAETGPFVLGGDFNAIPPGSLRTGGFPDEHPLALGTEFEQPPYRLDDMLPFFDTMVPWIPLTGFAGEAAQRRLYTHSVIGRDKVGTDGQSGFWNRTLDYLFASGGTWVAGESDVLQEPGRLGITSDPMLLSDHAPVMGTWVLP